ncbi:MAG: Protein translocase subunit SecY [candidate division TM6 bacterium GW2011_GWF2_37_49]|nr:MAG: Protein translocase subunit SecY [candidate division TM6 bacterium GW2011_GWF2_37_49]
MVQLHNFKNIFLVAELRKKLTFTLIIFAVFRFGSHITVPGVDISALYNMFDKSLAGGFLSYLDLFSGGALRYFSIFSLAVSPYISASIMIQLLTIMVPSLEALSKEGEYGRSVINQYTRYLTLGIALVQAVGIAAYVEHQPGLVNNPGWSFRLTAVLILSVGSLFVMWLGEQINAHGLGNGSSMIIFAGIVVNLPAAIFRLWENYQIGQASILMIALLIIILLGTIACIIFLERGERKVPVQYAKRVVGHKVYGGQSSYIPLKINPAGVVPVIFSSAILGMPVTIAGLVATRWPAVNSIVLDWFGRESLMYNVLNGCLIVFFTYFYTAIIFNPVELAENIRKSGGFIPGIRPGKRTADFFDYLLTRIGFPGAMYLATLAIFPSVIKNFISFPVFFSGVSLLIVVGVALDASAQIESHLIERRYDGFLSSGRLRGRYAR